jgi:hypothetical protein
MRAMTVETIPANSDTWDVVNIIRDALAAQFPTVAIRIASDDALAIEDERGDDWELIIRNPND